MISKRRFRLKRKATALLLLALLATAAYDPGDEREQIYASLDVLAEILTLADSKTPIEDKDILTGAIDGILEQLDPHSVYYDRDRFQTMKEDQQGSFHGIGVMVGNQNNRLTIVSAMEGGPAARAGMRAGDVIVRIGEVNTERMMVGDAVRLLRGDQGTRVVIAITRAGRNEPIELVLERSEIPNNNVRASFMLDQETGYAALADFGETATEELRSAIMDLQRAGMHRFLLDLRGNPGGLLPQAIGVASLFIPGRKLVVSTQGRMRSANREYTSERRSDIEQIPLIVLIDRGSASASEIVAGAIQDHDRGLIVGESSWGKGLVQSVFPLSSGKTGLALTTSRYYTPSGRNIQGSYVSWESYYAPESSEELFFSREDSNLEHAFQTTHGREVIQARGITPDVYVAHDRDPELVQSLRFEHNAFFNFATANQDRYAVPADAPDWQADDQILEAFTDYLRAENLPREGIEDMLDSVRQRLTYELFLISGDLDSENRVLRYTLTHDAQLAAARALYAKAEELLDAYNGSKTLSESYARELIEFAEMRRRERLAN